jgi:hypothetical protein
MKCSACGLDNKKTSKFCSNCGSGLGAALSAKGKPAVTATRELTPPDTIMNFWRPDWKWHARTLLIIYVVLTAVFFGLSRFLSRIPEPHRMRDIPKEMTPWLKQ